MTQTLIEGGKHVLLLERGGRKGPDSKRKETAYNGLTDNACIEVFDGDGVVLATGRCLGGATTYSQAVWIEEEPDFLDDLAWFDESGDNTFTADSVSQAYAWVSERASENEYACLQRSSVLELVPTILALSCFPLR